jgi:5-formyltetrahydrofolate cyclo-ligase
MSDTVEAKRVARTGARAAREAAHARFGAAAGAAVCENVLRALGDRPPTTVSAYWPMSSELDVTSLLVALDKAGHAVALPVVVARGRPLAFRRWRPGDTLVPGGFGTLAPRADAAALTPRVLIVPLLAFDRAGYRLGYGGGYYDRTLAALRREGAVTAIGVAFAEQEVARVPRGPGDEPLDLIVTDREIIRPDAASDTAGAP